MSGTPEWMADAACVGANAVFFLEQRDPDSNAKLARAKQVCAGCPVCDDCLVTAVQVGERSGIFGGLTVKERRRWARNNPVRLRTCLECDSEFVLPPKTGSPKTCCSDACTKARRAGQRAEYVQRRRLEVAS